GEALLEPGGEEAVDGGMSELVGDGGRVDLLDVEADELVVGDAVEFLREVRRDLDVDKRERELAGDLSHARQVLGDEVDGLAAQVRVGAGDDDRRITGVGKGHDVEEL